jgi:NADPH:quinone reductase-like Zn-dependent oxidoreductase
MRAIIHLQYGSADGLELRDVPRPAPAEGEVLVRVQAASMHADIWHLVTGRPYFMRLMGAGLRSPGGKIPGTDLAGVVEEVGRGVTRFQVGDAVFGECVRGHQWLHGGAFAEYAAVPERSLAKKPAGLGFEEAAALPTSAFIAYQAVFDEGALRPGEKVLVNGAAGGVGLFAVQLARASGAHVTGVDGPDRLELLRRAGVDRALDYTLQDYTTGAERYDLIVDVPGRQPLSRCLQVLAPGGRYVYIGHDHFGATGGRWLGSLGRVLRLVLLRLMKGERPRMPVFSGAQVRLAALVRLFEEGKLVVPIDRVFPLAEVPAALRYLQEGRARGKVVIQVGG